jgi:hypothetical protein
LKGTLKPKEMQKRLYPGSIQPDAKALKGEVWVEENGTVTNNN